MTNVINSDEIWKDIPGYEGKYQISTHGRVKSFCGKLPILNKFTLNRDGYYYVRLQHKTIPKTQKVHRLVAKTFIQKPEGKDYIDHIDGNKLNNRVENIRWVSFQENITYAWDLGLYNNIGEDHPLSKFSTKDVVIIKNMLKSGMKVKDILLHFPNVKINAIYNIKQGRRWAHIRI